MRFERDNTEAAIFRFEVIDENGKDVTIEITQEEYDKQIASGLSDDEVLKPGRHVFRRGGFRERHPNFNLENVEIRVINSEQSAPLAENDKEKRAA